MHAGAHERYISLRSSFYADISGVAVVVDLNIAQVQTSIF
jgi:hypothetical protein